MSVKIVSVIANLKTTIHGGLTKPVESVKNFSFSLHRFTTMIAQWLGRGTC